MQSIGFTAEYELHLIHGDNFYHFYQTHKLIKYSLRHIPIFRFTVVKDSASPTPKISLWRICLLLCLSCTKHYVDKIVFLYWLVNA